MKLTFVKKASAGKQLVKLPQITVTVKNGRMGFTQPTVEMLKLAPGDCFSVAQDEEENFYLVITPAAQEDSALIMFKDKAVFCIHKSAATALVDTLPSKEFAQAASIMLPIAGEATGSEDHPDARIYGLLTNAAKVKTLRKEAVNG